MAVKQLMPGNTAPDGSSYITLTDGAGNLASSPTSAQLPSALGTTGGLKTDTPSFSFANITTAATTTVKSGAGVLRRIIVNSLGTVASTATIYDNTAASGTKIATINTLSVLGSLVFDVSFSTGLTIVTTGTVAPDITVVYQQGYATRKRMAVTTYRNGNGNGNTSHWISVTISTVAILVALVGGFWSVANPREDLKILSSKFEHYLTLREHEEYKHNVKDNVERLDKVLITLAAEQSVRTGAVERLRLLEKSVDELRKDHNDLQKSISSSTSLSDTLKKQDAELVMLRERVNKLSTISPVDYLPMFKSKEKE